MRRVLVTGAGGFVGGHCVSALLERGFEVHAIGRRPPASSDVEWHQADLLDAGQVSRVVDAAGASHLLHLAWFVVPGEYWTSQANLPWIAASLQVVERFAAAGGQRAVLVGSGAEYDPRFSHCVESRTPLGPTTLYGAAKASLGLLLPHVAAAHGLEHVAWARLFYVFGPGEQPARLVPATIRALLADQPMPCSDGAQVRDPLSIEDAAPALVAVLESHVDGAVNIGSGHGVSIRSLLLGIGRLLGRESLLAFGARDTRPGEAAAQVADVTRLTREVGWRPRFTLEVGLERSIAWWRKELDGPN